MNCCDANGDCNQGRDCPVRQAKAAPGTHYCAKSRQPCTPPYTCATACKLITANSDSTSAHAPRTSIRPTLRWFAVLILSTALAALCIQHGARFF